MTTNLPAKRYDDPKFVALIKEAYCRGVSDEQFAVSLKIAQNFDLDPFKRQIYFVARYDNKLKKNTVAIQVSIDGYRLLAERTGKYRGQTPAEWCGKDGVWKDVWLDTEPPAAARVGVIRSDFAEPVYAVARYDSYVQTTQYGPTSFWKKMPDSQLAKCAESLALRKAFPSQLSGAHIDAEMAQATVVGPDEQDQQAKQSKLSDVVEAEYKTTTLQNNDTHEAVVDAVYPETIAGEFMRMLRKCTTKEELEELAAKAPTEAMTADEQTEARIVYAERKTELIGIGRG